MPDWYQEANWWYAVYVLAGAVIMVGVAWVLIEIIALIKRAYEQNHNRRSNLRK